MESLWLKQSKENEYPKLEQNKTVDVCIIGGGLTGITCGYLLSKKGFTTTILEKDRLFHKTSGNTTAKITSQHGLFYEYLIQSFGEEKAKWYLDANEQAIKEIKKIIEEEKIDCDLEEQSAYIFTNDIKEVEKIKSEVKAVNSLGKEAKFLEKTELPFQHLGAIEFRNQAMFHPVKYGEALAKKIAQIYENTKVLDIKKQEDGYEILTDKYVVKAKYVIIATRYPIINVPGFYFLKMYQQTSYLIAGEVKEPLFSGMYINSEKPTISLRTVKEGDTRFLIVGGLDHKTGTREELEDKYAELERIVKEKYPSFKRKYEWYAEDSISVDKIPYIGDFSALMPNVYVATGYKKWGMTFTYIAASIITDKIIGNVNPYEEVFTSTRFEPIKNIEEVKNMTKEVVYSLGVKRLEIPEENLQEIRKGEGKIIEWHGKKVGVYRDEQNGIHKIEPICSHLGCELSFNNVEKTWDCPCHGSRFTYDGESIEVPSVKDVNKL